MHLPFRPLAVKDLGQCLDMALEPVKAIALGYRTDAREVFEALLRENKLLGVVVHEPGDTDALLGFGTLLCLEDAACSGVLSEEIPCLISALFRPQFRDQQILGLREQEKMHLSDGVNLFGCFSGWRDDRVSIKDALGRSTATDLAGLNVRAYYKQIHEPDVALGYANYFGLPLRNRTLAKLPDDYPGRPPILVGQRRAEWQKAANPGQISNSIFDYIRPTFIFKPAQRMIFQALLLQPSLTNSELSGIVGYRFDTIGSYINEAFDTVFGPTSGNLTRKGLTEKRRKIIDFVQGNLQTIRPWVVMPGQRHA